MDPSATSKKPFANDRIFWDIDLTKLDFLKNDNFIIQRVIERGDVPDIRNWKRFYTPERITEVLTTTKYLPLRKIYLASAITDKPLSDFRCYRERQLMTRHLPY